MNLKQTSIRILSLGMLLAGFSSPAFAQPSYPVKPMAITKISGQWVLEGKHRTENHQRAGSENEEKSLSLQESITLNLLGYAYHPNLIDWGAIMQLGLDQNRTQIDGRQQDSDGMVMDYSLYALMFQKKILTLHATASQTKQTITRSFARPIGIDQQNQAIELSWKKAIATSLRFERQALKETSDIRIDKKNTWFASLQMQDNRNPNWNSVLRIEREQTDHTSTSLNSNGSTASVLELPSTRDQVTFQNIWTMSQLPMRPNLIGTIRMVKQQGFFENDLLAISQRITLHHTNDFKTYYDCQLSRDTTNTQQDQNFAAQTGLNWRIYDSMDIDAYLKSSDRKLENGTEKLLGAYADINYRKNVPVGKYRSTLKISRTMEQKSFNNSARNVRDESVTLTGLSASTLTQPNIQLGSLVVTDTTRTITYIQGIDYLLSTLGQFTQIARMATGSIADGQTVFIDYIAKESSNNEHTTNSLYWTHRLMFDNLYYPVSVYLNYRTQNQKLTAGTDPENLEQLNILVVGADMTLGSLLLGGEIEKRQQRLLPNMQAIRLWSSYTLPLRGDITLVANSGYENIQYAQSLGANDIADFQKVLYADISTTFKANQSLLLRINGSYRTSKGRQIDDLTSLAAELVFRKGLMDIILNASYSIFTQQDNQGDDMMISFHIQRTF